MRLIDADLLLASMNNRYNEKKEKVPDNLAEGFMQMEKLIKEQPTAYDVNKVVVLITEEAHNTVVDFKLDKYVYTRKVIEIVRAGGS